MKPPLPPLAFSFATDGAMTFARRSPTTVRAAHFVDPFCTSCGH
jgi:hypothetical protein